MTDINRSALNDLAASVFALEAAVKRLEQRLTDTERDVKSLQRDMRDRPLEPRRLQ